MQVRGYVGRGWIQVEVAGEDEPVALKLLDKEIGLAPASKGSIGKFTSVRGKIIDYAGSEDELYVDIGIFDPSVRDAIVPASSLRAQLADGRDVPIKRLRELFCLHDYFPLQIKIINCTNEKSWKAEISEAQIARFFDWVQGNVDRLIVLGARIQEIKVAIERSRHFRDIIKTESLGPLEQTILCKLGTDAVGLIPAVGRLLPKATFAPFSPRKIRHVIGRTCL